MAKKDKDKDKDKGKKKGFLGRIFGGKEGEGAPPETPEGEAAMDALTVYPDDREEDDGATIPPGRIVGAGAGKPPVPPVSGTLGLMGSPRIARTLSANPSGP